MRTLWCYAWESFLYFLPLFVQRVPYHGELFLHKISKGQGMHYVFSFWQLHTITLTASWLLSPRDRISSVHGHGVPVV